MSSHVEYSHPDEDPSKFKAITNQIVGSAKTMWGKTFNNEELTREGEDQRARGEAEEAYLRVLENNPESKIEHK